MQELALIIFTGPAQVPGKEIYRVCISGAEILKAVLEFFLPHHPKSSPFWWHMSSVLHFPLLHMHPSPVSTEAAV